MVSFRAIFHIYGCGRKGTWMVPEVALNDEEQCLLTIVQSYIPCKMMLGKDDPFLLKWSLFSGDIRPFSGGGIPLLENERYICIICQPFFSTSQTPSLQGFSTSQLLTAGVVFLPASYAGVSRRRRQPRRLSRRATQGCAAESWKIRERYC